MKVLVLYGGTSNERAVSIRSGKVVLRALSSSPHTVRGADPAKSNFDLTSELEGVDVVFPVLHGEPGESGDLQKKLDDLGIRYVGSGPEACRLTFDKGLYKEELDRLGIRNARWEVVKESDFYKSRLLESAFVLKPLNGGSSLDTLIINDVSRIPRATVSRVFNKYGTMLLEELIEGQEITVGVLKNKPLPIILIEPPEGAVFDYTNKYNGKTKETASPSSISSLIQKQAQELALFIHQQLGCKDLSRTDMIVSKAGELYVLETNTLPGMTDESLFPKAAKASGLGMDDLCLTLIGS